MKFWRNHLFSPVFLTCHCLSLLFSLRDPVWHSAWRHTTVFSFWWLLMQYQCGFGWMSSSQQQTSTAVIDFFAYVDCEICEWSYWADNSFSYFPLSVGTGEAGIHLRGWYCTWTQESVDKVLKTRRCPNTAEETVTERVMLQWWQRFTAEPAANH